MICSFDELDGYQNFEQNSVCDLNPQNKEDDSEYVEDVNSVTEHVEFKTVSVNDDDISSNKRFMKILSAVIGVFCYFPSYNEQLYDLQRSVGINSPIRFIKEVSTRWKSTYNMMERILKLVRFSNHLLEKTNHVDKLITDEVTTS